MKKKKLEVKLLVEPIWERRELFLKINPEGQVPVLMTKDDEYIVGASVIIEWLEDSISFNNLIGEDISSRAEVRRIMEWFNRKFNSEVEATIVYEKNNESFL